MAKLNDDDKTVITNRSQISSPTGAAVRHCPKCGLAVADTTNVCPQDGTQIFAAHEDLIASKYQFITVTGSGGMSVVYKARRHDTNEIVAIKMMHSLLMNEQAMKRFQQEAKAITSLRHPNIINVHDFGVSEHGQPYMVMDFIDGNTLADVIKEKGGLTVEESLHRFIQLCDALEHAHEVGVLHRDLKPSNIMISNRDGNFADARIVDFGIAKLLDKGNEAETDIGNLTRTGELFGSPLYMSPEQCRGSQVDARTDIYSMGCVMYETLTGRPPLKGASMVDTFVLQMTEVPPPMSEVCTDKTFPADLEAVIAKSLAKNPDERFQTMTELEYALMQIQPDKPGQKSSKTKLKRQIPLVSKTAQIALASAAAGFVIGAVVVSEVLRSNSQTQNSASIAKEQQAAKTNTPLPTAKSIDIADYAKRNRKIRKNLEGGDEGLAEALRGDDLGLQRIDLSEANPHITDQSGVLLRNLKSLTDLNLDDNDIGDRTLLAIENLPITRLSLRRTGVTDEGIFEFSHHAINKQLETLALTGCSRIGDTAVAAIGQHLKALKSLAISNLNFTDQAFAKLADLTLTRLFAEGTSITDAGVSTLAKMTSLKELQLNYTHTGDGAVEHLTGLSNLETLGLAGTLVTDKGTQSIAKLNQLKSLDLGYTVITQQGLKNLARLKHLTKIGLYNTKLKDQDLKFLAKFPQLQSLNLANTRISDAGVDEIVKLKNLEFLDVGGTDITDAGLKKFAAISNLKQVILYDLSLTLDHIRALKNKQPQVQIKLLAPDEHEDGFYDDPRNFKDYPNS
ncbi:MAG TPA: protein kinase [Drouetiella sp.]|jgi:serine/threonine protein kinase